MWILQNTSGYWKCYYAQNEKKKTIHVAGLWSKNSNLVSFTPVTLMHAHYKNKTKSWIFLDSCISIFSQLLLPQTLRKLNESTQTIITLKNYRLPGLHFFNAKFMPLILALYYTLKINLTTVIYRRHHPICLCSPPGEMMEVVWAVISIRRTVSCVQSRISCPAISLLLPSLPQMLSNFHSCSVMCITLHIIPSTGS